MPRVKLPPALRHGGYSATTLLPGEDAAAFRKLYADLRNELAPSGALEENIVATLTRLVWRKQNLAIFRTAELARDQYRDIYDEHCGKCNPTYSLGYTAVDPKAEEAAEAQAREDLGDTYELANIGDDQLLEDLSVEERLDAMIDKSLKRWLFVKGLKSLSPTQSASSTPAQKSLPRVPSPPVA